MQLKTKQNPTNKSEILIMSKDEKKIIATVNKQNFNTEQAARKAAETLVFCYNEK